MSKNNNNLNEVSNIVKKLLSETQDHRAQDYDRRPKGPGYNRHFRGKGQGNSGEKKETAIDTANRAREDALGSFASKLTNEDNEPKDKSR